MAHVTDPAHDDTHESPEDEQLRPLEERLRRLNWPQPPPGLRERSLEELRRKLSELSTNGDGAAANGGASNEAEPEERESSREGPA
jgi:hypothetical protein